MSGKKSTGVAANRRAVAAKSGGRSSEVAAAATMAARTMQGRQICDVEAGSDPGAPITPGQSREFSAFLRQLVVPKLAAGPEVFKAARDVFQRLAYLNAWLDLKLSYIIDGVRVVGQGAERIPRRLVHDLAHEIGRELLRYENLATHFIPDGAAMEGSAPRSIPRPVLLALWEVQFRDSQARPRIKIPDVVPSPEKKALLSALGQGEANNKMAEIGWDKQEYLVIGSEAQAGVDFRVVAESGNPLGQNFKVPSIYILGLDLAVMEVLRLGDYNSAHHLRDVPRQIKKGHLLAYGELAGQPTYHLKKKDIETIKKAVKDKIGAWDWITNFDVGMEFPFLDPKFFDKVKYDPAWERIFQWAGPLMIALRAGAGEAGTIAMRAWQAEGRAWRRRVQFAMEAVLNHPDFADGTADLRVRFNPFSFHSDEERRQYTSLYVGHGLMSPRTAREIIDLDDEEERARLKEAHADPDGHRPTFEAKQGLLSQPQPAPPAPPAS